MLTAHRLRVLLAAVATGAFLSSHAQAGATATHALKFVVSPVVRLPGLALGPRDEIRSFDMAVDDSFAHLAISTGVVAGEVPRYRQQLWYWRVPLFGEARSAPALLVGDRALDPRILVTSKRIRIAYSSTDSLRLLSSADRGVHWASRSLGPLPNWGEESLAWIAATGDTVELACAIAGGPELGVDTTSDTPDIRAARRLQGLYLVESDGPDSAGWYLAVPTPTSGGAGEPMLWHSSPGRASVIWVASDYRVWPEPGQSKKAFGGGARLYCVDWANGRSRELHDRTVRRDVRGVIFGGVIPGFIDVKSTTAVDDHGDADIVYDAGELRAARLTCPDSTFRSGPLAGTESAQQSGAGGSVAGVPVDGRTCIVWIDGRNRGNPFLHLDERSKIGALLSGTEMWKNNDVYCGVLTFDGGGAPKVVGQTRITAQGSYARWLRAERQGNSIVAIWSGKQKVGPTLDSHGASDMLFFARIEIRP